MKPLAPNPPAAVYRHVNAQGEILYIGCSINPMARFELHRSKSPWACEVVNIQIEWFASIDAAYAEEQRQIKEIRPPMNRQVNRKRRAGQPRVGPAILRRWMERNGVTAEALAGIMGYSVANVQKLIRPNALPLMTRRVDVSVATKGEVPTWVWNSDREEDASLITPESAAKEFRDNRRYATFRNASRKAGAA